MSILNKTNTEIIWFRIWELNIIVMTYSGFASVSGRFSGPLAEGARGRRRLLERRLSREGRSDTPDPGVVATSADSLFSAFSGSSAVCPSGLLIFCTCDDTSQSKLLASCFAKHQLQPYALQRHNTGNSKQIFLEKELRGYSPNSCVHVSVSDLYIPLIGLPVQLQENRWTERGYIYRSIKDT
jgi:hypothetical protein